jgi:hypothetical protein
MGYTDSFYFVIGDYGNTNTAGSTCKNCKFAAKYAEQYTKKCKTI